MTISTWLNSSERSLARVLQDKELAHQDVLWIASYALNKDRAWLFAHANEVPTYRQLWKLNRLLKRRLQEEPLAYIVGSAPFFGRDFFVDKRVLIPRPETEDLVEIALRRARTLEHPTILDIGTGSGAISITMALECSKATVLASDTSSSALIVAKKNAEKLDTDVRFFKGELLHKLLLSNIDKKSPLIVLANLPYLPLSDKRSMPKSVVGYEPSSALFAKDAGLSLNQKLIEQCKPLKPDTILLEIDPPQTKTLRDFAQSVFPDATIRIHQDRCGRDRILEIANH